LIKLLLLAGRKFLHPGLYVQPPEGAEDWQE